MSPSAARVARRSVLLALSLTVACAGDAPIPSGACSDPCPPIRVDHLVTLGAEHGPSALADFPGIARDSRGRYYVTIIDQSGFPPVVFDSTGRFLTPIGRRGSGPGEYESPNLILVEPGDTLHVFDSRNNRVTVLNPEYDVVRVVNGVREDFSGIRLANEDYVLGGYNYSPFVRYAPDGEELERFGPRVGRAERRARPGLVSRIIGPANGDGFWAARRFHEYELTRWAADGRVVRRFRPESAWFEPYERVWMPAPDSAPPASISGLWEDEDGRLWVLGLVAAPDWAEGLGPKVRGEGGQEYHTIENYGRLNDPIIEVLDARTGRSLGWRRFEGPPVGLRLVEPGLVASLRQSAVGWWYADIWSVAYEG